MFENEKEKGLNWISSKLEQNYQPKTLAKMFFTGIIGNILSWITALFAPDLFANFVSGAINIEGKVALYLLFFPFSFAFMTAFAICKINLRKAEISSIEKQFLDGYSENLKANKNRKIIMLSAMVGGMNAILLVFAVITYRITFSAHQ